jgi:hypothetical protein
MGDCFAVLLVIVIVYAAPGCDWSILAKRAAYHSQQGYLEAT